MDFEEWEYLPDARFLDFQEDGEKKKLMGKRGSFSRCVFNMDDRYFLCPSPKSPERNDSPVNPGLPKPVPVEDTVVPNIQASSMEADQDTVSQVFFKVKETEFVEMKLDSPKSGSRVFLPQIEAGKFQFEDEEHPAENLPSPRMTTEREIMILNCNDPRKDKVNWEESGGGMNLWKWTLNGVGAICSFGFAATVCILFFGNQQREVQYNPKIQFQFYTGDKSMNRMVHQASKLNEAITTVRGAPAPLNTAQITFGGYYDGI